MISVKNLKKEYIVGKVSVQAVKDVSFDIKEGEFVIIYGSSGSGKSTILHLISLIDEPTTGTVFLNGKNVSELSESSKTKIRLKKFGYVFQEYNVVPELTALENTFLPGLMTDVSKQELVSKAKRLLIYLGLESRLSHTPAELSGGEKQRVSIARSLINDPKIIFADEPTANLDSVTSEMIINLFKKLNLEMKLTVILVTHNPSFLDYADKIIYMQDGLIKKINVRKSKSFKKKLADVDWASIENLKEYIKESFKRNYPKEKITKHLLDAGWPKNIVEKALKSN